MERIFKTHFHLSVGYFMTRELEMIMEMIDNWNQSEIQDEQHIRPETWLTVKPHLKNRVEVTEVAVVGGGGGAAETALKLN